MSDSYSFGEDPWMAAARTAGQFSDPIFGQFARMPHARAELALSTQRLALQKMEEDRMQQLLQPTIGNLKSQAEENLAQTMKLKGEADMQKLHQGLAERQSRLSGVAGLDINSLMRMAQDPQAGLQLRQDLDASGVMPTASTEMPIGDLMKIIQSAVSGQQQGIVGTDAGAMQRHIRPPSATGQTYSLSPGQSRFDMQGNKLASLPPNPLAARRSPQDQIVNDVARGIASGQIDIGSPEMLQALSMTNLLSGAQSPLPAQPMVKKAAPNVGTIQDGYEYLGGDPGKPESWRAVQ